MHILYLHQYLCPPGGSGNNRSWELAVAWRAQGHQVSFITSPAFFPEPLRSQCMQAPQTLEIAGITVHVLPVAYSHMMPFRERIRAFLRFYRSARAWSRRLPAPDLIYASSTPLTVAELGYRLARRWDRPWFFETVDVWPDVPEGMGILRNRLLLRFLYGRTRRLYAAANGIVCLSEGMRDQVMRQGVPAAKILVSHNGTHPEVFPWTQRPFRDPVTVLYAGTVGRANGVDALVRAAHLLRQEAFIRFRVLGSGNDLERVKALAADLKLTNLEFLPPVPKEHVAALLDAADIGVVTFAPFPVLEANSANKFYDYLASGLPVVLNYGGWQAQYLDAQGGGLWAPQGDDAAFAAQIRRLAADHLLRQKLGAQGSRLARSRFDRRVLAGQLLTWMQARLNAAT